MKVNRVASIPLVLHDPFFSIWSSADCLYDADTVHWSGIRQQLRGYVTIDGRTCCFMGDREFHEVIEQRDVDITPTATEYTFDFAAILTSQTTDVHTSEREPHLHGVLYCFLIKRFKNLFMAA